MKLGILKPSNAGEKRLTLLPEHIEGFENDVLIEAGFGESLEITDKEYADKGCTILFRKEIYEQADALYSMKGIPEEEYDLLQDNQIIIGWIHPQAKGKAFMEGVATDKHLIILNIDNTHPTIAFEDKIEPIPFIRSNFTDKNSVTAGYVGTIHSMLSYGKLFSSTTNIAILGSGNVSQGAMNAASKLGAIDNIRMFYRSNLDEFYKSYSEYDVIINGIAVTDPTNHMLTYDHVKNMKKGTLVVDLAAQPGEAVEFSKETTYDEPLLKVDDIFVYCIRNIPSLVYRTASEVLSESFTNWVFKRDLQEYIDLAKEHGYNIK